MKLKFINHASVLIDCGEVRILTDPWYSGAVFNNGWSLMCEKDININDLDFNYLWYSHEHPDHFSPQELKKIPKERRKDITILFQCAPDQKVKSFCESIDYTVMEMVDGEEYQIKDTVKAVCGQEGGFDSWLSIKSLGKHLLNINDCRVETPEALSELKRFIGEPDVLLTQFGWANWVGNKDDSSVRKVARKMIFDKLDNQIKYLNPKYLLPFASYSWFSHEENIHLNQGQITVREFVDTYSNKEIIPLFLDEEWEVGQKHDVQKSMSKWANILDSPKVCTPVEMPVSYDELLNQFNKMFSELNDHNDMISLRLDDTFRATVIELTDYPANENKILFDSIRGTFCFCESKTDDVKMGSNSLRYLMQHAWGRGTLTINGRFEANYKTFRNFLRQTHIYFNNNIGKIFPRDIAKQDILYPKSFVYELIEESS